MNDVDVGAEVFLLVGGLVLGAMALGRGRSRYVGLGIAGTFVFAAVGAALAQLPAGYFLPPAMLGGGYLLLFALYQARNPILWAVRNRRLHAILMFLASPLLAVGWLVYARNSEGPHQTETLVSAQDSEPTEPQLADFIARTDSGKPVQLYQQIMYGSPDRIESNAANLRRGLGLQLIQTAGSDLKSNCHGWVFTDGRYCILGEDVERILEDNGYKPVSTPRPGDLVIYRNTLNTILHSGIVRTVEGELILVESKWGAMGRFLHYPATQEYASEWTYYRSSRTGHSLRIEPQLSGPAATAHR